MITASVGSSGSIAAYTIEVLKRTWLWRRGPCDADHKSVSHSSSETVSLSNPDSWPLKYRCRMLAFVPDPAFGRFILGAKLHDMPHIPRLVRKQVLWSTRVFRTVYGFFRETFGTVTTLLSARIFCSFHSGWETFSLASGTLQIGTNVGMRHRIIRMLRSNPALVVLSSWNGFSGKVTAHGYGTVVRYHYDSLLHRHVTRNSICDWKMEDIRALLLIPTGTICTKFGHRFKGV